MKIEECMQTNLICASEDETVLDCAKKMKKEDVGCLPICDKEKNIVGIVTDRDIVTKCIGEDKDASNIKVSDIMTKGIISCNKDQKTDEAGSLMGNYQIKRLPVVENGKLVGLITIADLVRQDEIDDMEICDILEEICSISK